MKRSVLEGRREESKLEPAQDAPLNAMAYAVLGMVALRGPTTPYQLERAVRRSIGYFWHFPRSHFHSSPARLAAQGLLREEREDTGRRRRIYSITKDGRRALEGWLNEPTTTPMEVRDEGALKLFLGELGSPDAVAALARAQAEAHQRRVSELLEIASRFTDSDGGTTRLAPLGLGLRVMQAGADYWREVAAQPPQGAHPRDVAQGDREREPERGGR